MGCGKQTHAPLPCPAQCIYRSIWSSTLLRLANSAGPPSASTSMRINPNAALKDAPKGVYRLNGLFIKHDLSC